MDAVSSLTFAKLLKRYRLAAGLTQEELAERAAISARAVSDLERGLKTRPHRDTVELLAGALGLSPEERAQLERAVPRRRRGPPPEPRLRSSLPTEMTPLIGREREEARAVHLLRWEGVRLLTLTGAGGVGKTRLALRIAETMMEDFEDGVVFVPLEAIRDPALVASNLATALGLREHAGQPIEEVLHSYLTAKRCLLLFDNFEQITDAALLVSRLLAACAGVKVLVTSRVPLRLQGEYELDVPPLSVPESGSRPVAEHVTRYPATALLVSRLRAVKPDFAVTDDNTPLLFEICRRLDGLPLAIELAAARAKVLPLAALLERLDRRLQLLTGGVRDLPERQRTMRAAIAWSYELLDGEERTLFRQLSVFSGGCDLPAAESVCDLHTESDLLDPLSSLVDKSLLVMRETGIDQPRCSMLETVREFAAEHLETSGEADRLRRRHVSYFLMLAEEAEQQLAGPNQVDWIERLEREHDNLRAALGFARDSGGAMLGQRLAGALWRFWSTRGYLSEGRRWLHDMLDPSTASGEAISPATGKALAGAAMLAIDQGAYDQAAVLCERSVAISRDRGERGALVLALNVQGTLARQQGRWDDALASYGEALALAREIGDRCGEGAALAGLANATGLAGDRAGGEMLQQQVLALVRELGDIRGIADTLLTLGLQAGQAGEFERAERLEEEALSLFRALDDTGKTAEALYALGMFAALQGQYERAMALQEQSLALRLERDDERNVGTTRAALGLIALNLGDVVRARGLVEEALAGACGSNDRWGQSVALTLLGHVELAAADTERADRLLQQSATLFQALSHPFYTLWCLEGLAGVAAAQGRWKAAARLSGAREAFRAHRNIRIPPAHPSAYASTLAAARAALGEKSFAQEQEAGREMSVKQTIAEALI